MPTQKVGISIWTRLLHWCHRAPPGDQATQPSRGLAGADCLADSGNSRTETRQSADPVGMLWVSKLIIDGLVALISPAKPRFRTRSVPLDFGRH